MRPLIATLAIALLTLAPAVAWASWPLDIVIELAAGTDQYIGIERPGPAEAVRLTIAKGPRCVVWLTLPEAEAIADAIVDAAYYDTTSEIAIATGETVRAIALMPSGETHLEIDSACQVDVVLASLPTGSEADKVADVLYEAAS